MIPFAIRFVAVNFPFPLNCGLPEILFLGSPIESYRNKAVGMGFKVIVESKSEGQLLLLQSTKFQQFVKT